MLWTTFLFSLLLHSTATFNSWPVPPETTEEQRAVQQRAIQKAKQASEEATPKVGEAHAERDAGCVGEGGARFEL